MSFSFADVLPIAMLGGILGLDVVGFPQAMISRPLVAATLSGALIGEAFSGMLIGAALELIALETLPFGAAKYPEWGSAATVGGALFASHPSHPAGSMTVAVIASIATGWIGAWTMYQLRRLMTMIIAVWDTDAMTSRSLVVGVAASVAMGAAWKLFHAVPWARWAFLAGLVVGVLLLLTK
jgi:mannose/fructose/N-acetylgalactosamine-specific phosphotransferase system component IIC